MPAGVHTISVEIGFGDPGYPTYSSAKRGYGRAVTSYMMAEEIYPN